MRQLSKICKYGKQMVIRTLDFTCELLFQKDDIVSFSKFDVDYSRFMIQRETNDQTKEFILACNLKSIYMFIDFD